MTVPKEPDPGESIADFRMRQKRAAIKMAQQTRTRNKLMRLAIKKGQVDDLSLLRGDLNELEPLIKNWPLKRLLLVMNGVGEVRMQEILDFAHLKGTTPVRRLTFEQRLHLSKLVVQARDPWGALLERQP